MKKNLVILLMSDILHELDNTHFGIFLFDIVKFYRDRKAKDILKLLKYMMANINNNEIIQSLLDDVNTASQLRNNHQQNSLIRNIVDIITEITRNGNKESVEENFDPITQFLLDFIDSQDTEVRRSIILALVELSIAFENDDDQAMKDKLKRTHEKLTKVQQKLVSFYRDQRE